MEISGKIITLLAEQKGQGKNGEWKKQEFILQTTEQYPKKVCISVWGDKVAQFSLNIGDSVTASISVESREFNSRWYTDVRAWKIVKGSGSRNDVPPDNNDPMPFDEPDMPNDGSEGLPF